MTVKTAKRRSRKKIIITLVIIAVIVIAGFIAYSRLQAMTGQVNYDIPETVTLTKTNLESKVTASGNFSSTDPVTIGSNVQGSEVVAVYVEEGSKIYAGDVLARLKTSEIERNIADTQNSISDARKSDQQKLDSAQRAFNDADAQYYANLEQNDKEVSKAEKNLSNRKDDLHDAKDALKEAKDAPDGPEKDAAIKAAEAGVKTAEAAVSAAKDALDKAEQLRESTLRTDNSRWYDAKAQLDSLSGVDSARQMRSQLESLNENLENASIISPITGIVTQVNTEEGKAVMGNMFVVENTEALQISATVAEYDVIKIENGMAAHITSNATGDEAYEGVVDFVAPTAADTSGNFVIKVLVTSPVGKLKPGMTATVEIVIASKENIFAVPIDAVVAMPDGKKAVYAFEPGAGPMMIYDNAGRGPSGNGGGPAIRGGGPAIRGGNTPGGNNIPSDANRREILVKTGMETDYYIEIISDELEEGMLILSDPLGRNVIVSGGSPFGMMGGREGGGQAVYVESSGPSQTVTVID